MNLAELPDADLLALRQRVGAAGRDRIDAILEQRRTRPDPPPPADAAESPVTPAETRPVVETPARRRGKENATERAWRAVLESDPDVADVRFEAIKFRLADGTWYTPDFLVRYRDGRIELHEVKGFWRSRDRVRFKVGVGQFPWWTWKAVMKRRKKDGGGWAVEVFHSSAVGNSPEIVDNSTKLARP